MAKSDFPAMLWNASGECRTFNSAADIPRNEAWHNSHPHNWPAKAKEVAPEPQKTAPRRPVRLNAPD